jgi:hypothetical protein
MLAAHFPGQTKLATPIQDWISVSRPPNAVLSSLGASISILRVITKLAFDILSDSMHLAIRQLDGLGSGSVLHTILGKTRPHGDSLADIIGEIFSLCSAPFQSGKRNSFKSPGGYLTVGFLYIQVKIPMRVLPFKTRKRACEIHALICIELGRKRVMRGRWNRGGEQCKSRHQNTGESALHDFLLEHEQMYRRNPFTIDSDSLRVTYHT